MKKKIDHRRLYVLSQELTDFIHKIQGLYLDSIIGYKLINESVVDVQQRLKLFLKDDPDVDNKLLDDLSFNHQHSYGKEFAASGIHFAKNGEIKERNRENGCNHSLIANMCVVMLYAYWEGYLRNGLKEAYSESHADDIKFDFWGDMRRLRIDIIHNKQKCKESQKAKILLWFKSGQEIVLDHEKMRTIFLETLRIRNKIFSDSLPEMVLKIPINYIK